MKGEIELPKLLASLKPYLQAGTYVFVSLKETPSPMLLEASICIFREAEGTTLILEKADADQHQLSYSYEAAWITLEVHSALEAVGLTAAFATALTQHRISCNVVAGYYHDHIFVAKTDAEQALAVLVELSQQ